MSLDNEGFLSSESEPYRERIRANNLDYFEFVEELNRFCQQEKYRLSIHNRDGQEVFAGCLLIKLLNDVQAVVILFEKGLALQGRSIIRVALESLIVLGKNCDSAKFFQEFIKIGEAERLKLVRSIKHHPTKVFDDIKPELTEELIKQIQERIGEKGNKKNIEQWSKDVKLHHLYAGAYRLYSQEVHSIPRALNEYLMLNQEGEVIGFEWGPKEDEDLRAELLEIGRYLIYGMSFINELFNINIGEKLQSFDNRYKGLDTEAMNKS